MSIGDLGVSESGLEFAFDAFDNWSIENYATYYPQKVLFHDRWRKAGNSGQVYLEN